MVRKQLARALRQEGCVVEAIVQLMTAEDPTQGLPLGPAAAAAAAPAAGEAAAQQAGSGGGKGASSGGTAGVRGGQLFPDFMSLSEGADSWSAAANWPVTSGDEPSATPALLRRLWARAGHGRRSLGRGLSRLSQGLRGSRANLRETAAAAAAMGIHPDLYVAVEPIYAMSGPTAASMQARGAWGWASGPCGCRPWRKVWRCVSVSSPAFLRPLVGAPSAGRLCPHAVHPL